MTMLAMLPAHPPDVDSHSFVAEAERDGYVQLVADPRRGFDLLAARKAP